MTRARQAQLRPFGGSQKAIVKEFKGVAVKDGVLRVEFVSKQQNPEINGIEILAE